MERVKALIQKLQQLLNENATADQLMPTVQMLYAELNSGNQTSVQNNDKKIAVIMPRVPALIIENKLNEKEAVNYHEPELLPEEKIIEVLYVDEREIEEELEEIKRNVNAKNKMSMNAKPALLFDPVEDVPTLAQQTPVFTKPVNVKDINETAPVMPESLNESLKEKKTELAEKLKEEPLKDLKKGIGVNDRFLFINELFRGDEAMYERSIKTINNFSILAEAEYWIRRELKVKIGWNDSDPVVKQFDQLVRRRFA